ncbi:mediator of RNA polymerase II transcription subunit 11 [[Candida] anglica]|uniref:Mediator of RNA polymerase II transcription subunit 11 n=1 Tax=[Candida] anglica TaxID=148631 RepID=A0ABP0E937_9ASCO
MNESNKTYTYIHSSLYSMSNPTFIQKRINALHEIDCKVVSLLDSMSTLLQTYTLPKTDDVNSKIKEQFTVQTNDIYGIISTVAIDLRKEVRIMDENIGVYDKNDDGVMILPISVDQKNSTLGEKKLRHEMKQLSRILKDVTEEEEEEEADSSDEEEVKKVEEEEKKGDDKMDEDTESKTEEIKEEDVNKEENKKENEEEVKKDSVDEKEKEESLEEGSVDEKKEEEENKIDSVEAPMDIDVVTGDITEQEVKKEEEAKENDPATELEQNGAPEEVKEESNDKIEVSEEPVIQTELIDPLGEVDDLFGDADDITMGDVKADDDDDIDMLF